MEHFQDYHHLELILSAVLLLEPTGHYISVRSVQTI